jgi:hypothetical protein
VLVGAIPNSIGKVLSGAETVRVHAAAKVISQGEHVVNAGLSAFREALGELRLSGREGGEGADDGDGGLHLERWLT